MAQVEMFPAVANSPATELTAALTDIATTVSLLDASKLPDAPNIATIGVDESAETIKYTGKSGNDLTGVTRGFSGTTAKAWLTGVPAARYFTAYDADALRENVAEVNTQLADITLNLRDFGLNGVDDTPAYVAAHAALPADGGTILVPNMSKVTGFTFTKTVKLRGYGQSFSGTTGPTIITSGVIELAGEGSSLMDCNIIAAEGYEGTLYAATGGSAYGENLQLIGGGDAMIIGSLTKVWNYNCFNFKNINIREASGVPLTIAHPNTNGDTNAGNIFGVHIQSSVGHGIRLVNANNNTLTGTTVENITGSSSYALKFENSSGNVFPGCTYLENNPDREIHFDATSAENQIDNLRAGAYGGSGVVDLNGTNLVGCFERSKAAFNWIMGELIHEITGVSKHGIGGYWRFEQTDDRGLKIGLKGFDNTNANIDLRSETADNTLLIDKIQLGTGGQPINLIKAANLTLFVGTVPAHGEVVATQSISGVTVGTFVQMAPLNPLPTGIKPFPYISSAGTLSVQFTNNTAADIAVPNQSAFYLFTTID